MSLVPAIALERVSVVLAGSGGSGVMTSGGMLLEAAARAGYYGLFSKLFGPQVRGGEAAALLTLGAAPVECGPDLFDLFVAVDWSQVERFAAEIPLSPQSIVISDPKSGAVPAGIAVSGARCVQMPFSGFAAKVPGARPNMVALGMVAALLGLPLDALEKTIARRLADKGEALVRASVAAAGIGYTAAPALDMNLRLPPIAAGTDPAGRWLLSGDTALALGGLRGGVRFVAGYPITPATEMVEWMTPALERVGGRFVQAEDELAAINMAIGGAFGGVPSMTVTSGPGFSLMTEGLGLAIAAEIPVVLLDVQRAGPSTGIPSKTEQSDLNLALYGAHGDAPHLVLAPTSIGDGLATMQWAVELAEALQTAAVVLSDQQMGQAHTVIDAPAGAASAPTRVLARPAPGAAYRRYAITADGVSPMATPGTPGAAWVGDGLTHNESGTPVSAAKDHVAQINKRRRKLALHDFGARWADVEGDGDLAVITWGSSAAPVRVAIARLRSEGAHLRLIVPRLLAPLQKQKLAGALAGVVRALVIEQNDSGQLCGYLRAQGELPAALSSYSRPGPLPLRAVEVHAQLKRWGLQ
jgi:2-oxoglutarate ferredoxin oxidoreductase subunit alpha